MLLLRLACLVVEHPRAGLGDVVDLVGERGLDGRVVRVVACAFEAFLLESECFADGVEDGVGDFGHFVFPSWRDCHGNIMEDLMRADKVRNGLDYDGPEFDPGCDCSTDPYTGEELVSATKQSFAEECDINNIMRRYESTGTIDHVNRREPHFGDFTDVPSYHEALEIARSAEAAFAALPSSVRDRFGNDPGKLMEFLADPANRDEAIELGLIDRPPAAPEPVEVRVVDREAPEGPPVAQGATPSKGA